MNNAKAIEAPNLPIAWAGTTHAFHPSASKEISMSKSSKLSRRDFMATTAIAGTVGVGTPMFVSSSALASPGKPGANDRIQIGLIGCGGMGRVNLGNCAQHPDVAVTGVCDVWKERLDQAAAAYKGSAKPYTDYREMLDQDDIDGVIIATPPHWHAMQAIHAVEAGKDIYLQKPMSLHVAESLAVKRAVERHNRISQIGTQIHARANYRRVVELIRSGNLGKVSVARTFLVMNQGPAGIGNDPNTGPPKGLDWDFWVGPYPMRPFNPLLVKSGHYRCSFMDFGNWTPGMAPHLIDLPYWALELDFPTITYCSGGRYIVDDAGDAPDVQEAVWQYPDVTMTWMMSIVNSYGFDLQGEAGIKGRRGIYFHGVNGTLYSGYDDHNVVPEGDRMKDAKTPEPSIPPSPGHEREWLDCMRTRKQPSCSVFYHYKIDVAIGLATLSYKLGRSIRFDPATRKIVGDDEAARLAKPEYRHPWKFPEQYL